MGSLSLVFINVFAIIILALVYIDIIKHKNTLFSNRLFLFLVLFGIYMLCLDSLAWLSDSFVIDFPTTVKYLIYSLFYASALIPIFIWMAYVDYQINSSLKRIKAIKLIAIWLCSINALASFSSIITGWYFTVDSSNAYIRGPLLLIYLVLCYGTLLFASLLVIIKRRNIEKKVFYTMLLYPVPIYIGSVLQPFVANFSLYWPGMALSLLIVYFNYQNTWLNSDYLTGLYNKRLFDSFIDEKIAESLKGKTFSGMLIDMDQFKKINDTLGHNVGDEALIEFAQLLKSSLRSEDIVARHGGDEFYILLDIDNKQALSAVAERIRLATEEFNKNSNKPYKLKYSIGYDVYSAELGMNSREFIDHLDKLMYLNKSVSAK